MAFIFSFSDDRIKQLERDDKINDQLLKDCKECPEVLARYFYLQKKKNKQQTEKVADARFFETYAIIKKNMEENDKHLDRVEKELDKTENSPCKWLEMIGKYDVELPFNNDTFMEMIISAEINE